MKIPPAREIETLAGGIGMLMPSSDSGIFFYLSGCGRLSVIFLRTSLLNMNSAHSTA